MIEEPFAIGQSWIHRIDPRSKIIYAAIYSTAVAVSSGFPTLTVSFGFSILLIGLARLNLTAVFKRLSVVLGFIVLIWITLPLTTEGDSLIDIGSLTLSVQGIHLSARITIKSMTILITLMALIATMTIPTLGHSLNRLHVPGKIVQLLVLTYRYIFVFEDEYQRLLRAAKVRGFRPGTNIHSYKTYAYLIGMLLVRAWARAERVHQAMRCRGFKGKFYALERFPSGPQNRVFVTSMTFLVAVLVFLEWYL